MSDSHYADVFPPDRYEQQTTEMYLEPESRDFLIEAADMNGNFQRVQAALDWTQKLSECMYSDDGAGFSTELVEMLGAIARIIAEDARKCAINFNDLAESTIFAEILETQKTQRMMQLAAAHSELTMLFQASAFTSALNWSTFDARFRFVQDFLTVLDAQIAKFEELLLAQRQTSASTAQVQGGIDMVLGFIGTLVEEEGVKLAPYPDEQVTLGMRVDEEYARVLIEQGAFEYTSSSTDQGAIVLHMPLVGERSGTIGILRRGRLLPICD